MPKFCTFSHVNSSERRVGLHDGSDIVDLTAALGIATMTDLITEGKQALSDASKVKGYRVAETKVNILSPVSGDNVGKVLCVGMNYVDHCTEQNYPIPKEPIIFNKVPQTIINPGDDIQLPEIIPNLDFEVELAIVIGKPGRNIPESQANDHIFGYTVAHDVSARHWQLEKNGKQWFVGKTFDTFTPLGPAIVTADSIKINECKISCTLNGDTVQDSNTNQLIFNCPKLVAWCSQFMTLKPGDVILTGTPPGVGCFRKPPMWLKAGDVVTCQIEGIGAITNKVVKYDAAYTCPEITAPKRAQATPSNKAPYFLAAGFLFGTFCATMMSTRKKN